MKRLNIVTLIVFVWMVAAFPSAGFASEKQTAGKGQVVVYNWSEYIPQDVLDDFTKETGIKVVYSTFESNEAMYTKLKLLRGKGYDIVVPSGYFVDMMAQDGLLQPLDHGLLSNLKNIDEAMLSREFDGKNVYSVPYMWGAVGIAYNKKYITDPALLKKWDDFKRPELKGKLIMTDDLRDAFGLAFRATGHSVNATDEASIRDAYGFLRDLKASVRVFDVTAIKQALISEEVWAGPIWNGDYLVAVEENDALAYVFPEEGAILWVDNFVIPSGAENVANAHAFINFMCRPEVAKRCVEEFKYSTPNKAALDLLDKDMRENHILVPTQEDLKNAQFPVGIGAALGLYEKYWEELKTAR